MEVILTGKSSAKLTIGPVRVFGYHGVFEEEKRLGCEFEVVIEFVCDISKLCKTDDVKDSVDYTAVVDIIKRHFKNRKYNLLEKCAFEIKSEIIHKFINISNVNVKILKKNPPVENVECFIVEV